MSKSKKDLQQPYSFSRGKWEVSKDIPYKVVCGEKDICTVNSSHFYGIGLIEGMSNARLIAAGPTYHAFAKFFIVLYEQKIIRGREVRELYLRMRKVVRHVDELITCAGG